MQATMPWTPVSTWMGAWAPGLGRVEWPNAGPGGVRRKEGIPQYVLFMFLITSFKKKCHGDLEHYEEKHNGKMLGWMLICHILEQNAGSGAQLQLLMSASC